MDNKIHSFPAQQLPFSKKGKKWRRQCVDFACDNTFLSTAAHRNSVLHKTLNYDLFNGKLHMDDLEMVLNPTGLKDDLVPETIQHFPIMNSKLEVLVGEEYKRVFDYKAIVTDYNSISEISENKTKQLLQSLQQLVQDTASSEEQANQKLEELTRYYTYTWQDFKEARANMLLHHYDEVNPFAVMFNEGFKDAEIVGEELYQCDIVGGEPTIERLDPRKVTAVRSSNSKYIEDADMIIIDDYWSPGKIVDYFYDVLTPQDREYIEKMSDSAFSSKDTDDMGNIHAKNGFLYIGDTQLSNEETIKTLFGRSDDFLVGAPYDFEGNIRVTRVYWKSRRKIKKVTSYTPETGEEIIDFYPETYIPNKDMGEKEETLWINEAWEGTRIGEEVYVNIRPRPIQYNVMSNPSRCHFGIVGTLYSVGGDQPYSLVDMMKPYNYLYDVVHDRLIRTIARNYGKLINLDLAFIPDEWKVDKWLYFARKDGIAIKNSFNEANKGSHQGILAGGLNNASTGVIDLDTGNTIQQYINILEFLKLAMSELIGISKQREGQISNRETVGGIERATLQSSHITEWIFIEHDFLKKRALDVFLETAKIALKGKNKSFQYKTPDYIQKMVFIDGDEFAESDYGITVDISQQAQEINQRIDTMVQAALQNQSINFSTALKMFTSCSLAEKMRMIENNERELQQMQQQQQQQQLQVQQQDAQMRAQVEQQKLELENALNERDNDTRLAIAVMQNAANENTEEPENTDSKEQLLEKMREFDLKLQLDKDRLAFDKEKAAEDRKIKREQIHSKTTQKK